MNPRLHGDHGQIGGIEAVPFSILVFVVGMILAINGWSVVYTQTNARSAARTAIRTFVEQDSYLLAEQAARSAVVETLQRSGFATHNVLTAIDFPNGDSWHRCARVRIVVSMPARSFPVPFIEDLFSAINVRASESGLVDAYRSANIGGEADCQ